MTTDPPRPPRPPCTRCGHPLSPGGRHPAEGTRRHYGHGLCEACAASKRRADKRVARSGNPAPRQLRPLTPPQAWMTLAACAGRIDNPERDPWFPDSTTGTVDADTKHAKRICRRCPVRQLCLNHALRTGEPHGVWGGLSAPERHRIRLEAAS